MTPYGDEPPTLDTIPNQYASWHDISWKQVNREVRKLRSRIFAATRDSDYKQVRSLQRLMIKSTSNLLYCIRRITMTNKGKRTEGIDKLTYLSPESRMELFHELKKIKLNSWKPSPIRRKFIPKPNGKLRPLGIPTVKDRILQLLVVNALEPEWEFYFESSRYGFRPGRSVNDCMHRIYNILCSKGSREWIVDADIKACFDEISHEYLLKLLEHFPYRFIIEKWLKSQISIDGTLHSSIEGTPQGGAISPLLCNIALHGLEMELGIKYKNKENRIIASEGRAFIRYADDILIFTHSEEDAIRAQADLESALEKRGLTVSQEKTRIVHITQGFDFLGFNVKRVGKDFAKRNPLTITRGTNGVTFDYKKTLIKISPSAKAILNYKTKIKDIFKRSKGTNAARLIKEINPVIRGWCNSKRAFHCSRIFQKLNNYIYLLCWRWMIRAHPKKSITWLKERYFFHLKEYGIDNRWVFSAPRNRHIFMYRMIWFTVQRHIMIKNNACPDDPDFKDYFKNLEKNRFENKKISGINSIHRTLADKQNLTCPVCDSPLYNDEALHLHHIIPRRDGGDSKLSNLTLLHWPCHYRITYGKDSLEWQKLLIQLSKARKEKRDLPNKSE